MKIIDKRTLSAFRRAAKCEYCGRKTPCGADPHHVFAKGMGGGGRLDVRFNLLSLCRYCHTLAHTGRIPRCDLLAIVAAREETTQDAIEQEIFRLRRTRPDLAVTRE